MNTLEVHRMRTRLSNLFDKGKEKHISEDLELQSNWARYLCVLVSGFLEASVRTIYYEYTRTKAAPNVANYVDSQMSRFTNAKMDRILELTRSFSAVWADSLRVATQGRLKSSVDSVVDLRHKIAHGEPTGVSFSIISQYFTDVVRVIEIIEEQCRQ